jgi:hypothetical protein
MREADLPFWNEASHNKNRPLLQLSQVEPELSWMKTYHSSLMSSVQKMLTWHCASWKATPKQIWRELKQLPRSVLAPKFGIRHLIQVSDGHKDPHQKTLMSSGSAHVISVILVNGHFDISLLIDR